MLSPTPRPTPTPHLCSISQLEPQASRGLRPWQKLIKLPMNSPVIFDLRLVPSEPRQVTFSPEFDLGYEYLTRESTNNLLGKYPHVGDFFCFEVWRVIRLFSLTAHDWPHGRCSSCEGRVGMGDQPVRESIDRSTRCWNCCSCVLRLARFSAALLELTLGQWH